MSSKILLNAQTDFVDVVSQFVNTAGEVAIHDRRDSSRTNTQCRVYKGLRDTR